MKKIALRILILLLVFIGGVVGTSFFMNGEISNDSTELENASFPEVMIEIGGIYVNRMFGYADKMQTDFARDSLTPMDASKKITLVINPYSCDLYNLSYEIRTSDGSKVIENSSTRKLSGQDSYFKTTLELKAEEMRMNQEYSLQITLDTSAGEIYYYTRVIQRSKLNTEQYVRFVQNFYEKCMNKDSTPELSAYIESDDSVADNSFTSINIHSSLDMVTWGDLSPTVSKRAIPVIKDINETTGSIAMDYELTAQNENGQTEVYNVTEFYRMRYTENGVWLLDFNRNAQQVFDGNLPVADTNGLDIGVSSKDLQYMSSPSGEIVAFVQQGDLWAYNSGANKFTRIFSFRQAENGDARDANSAHDMKIVRLGDSGDMDFVVYGYFNRGAHEGVVGVGVYRYSSDQNLVEERIFIPSTESYEFLRMDLDNLSYINEQNQLFLYMGGNLYRIDIDGHSCQILQEGIKMGNFVASSSGASGAWMDGPDPNHCTTIGIINFETCKIRKIRSEEGVYIKALGFLNEDFVYGFARSENVMTDATGRKVFAMSSFRIEDFEGNIVKEYSQPDQYIIDVKMTDSLMEIQLARLQNNTFTAASLDNIMNNRKAEKQQVTLGSSYTPRRKFITYLNFGQPIKNNMPVVVIAKQRDGGRQAALHIDAEAPMEDVYYVYAGGKLDSVYTDPAQAVAQADAKVGVVLNRAQQYVWERGNKKTKIQLNLSDIPATVLKGTLDYEALAKELDASCLPMNLAGCTLDQALYSVSAQRPVIAARGDGGSYVIVGYDQYNTIVYNPDNQETKYMAMDDSTELFQNAGNVFYSYMERIN